MPRFWRARPVFVVIATVMSVAALAPRETAAASCAGQSHALTLSDGGVSPGTGKTADRYAFAVTYTDSGACAPDRIVVVIGGVGTYTLSPGSGTLQAGLTFGRRLRLPAGRWHYWFEASSGTGVGRRDVQLKNVDPTVVVVAAPTPKPTPKPTPRPSPRPAAGPTPSPRAAPTAKPSASTTPAPSDSPGPSAPASSPASGLGSATAPAHPGGVMPGAAATGGMSPLMLAVVASTVGTIGGLALFGVLGMWLLAPRRSRAVWARRPSGERDPVFPEQRT